MNFGQIGKLKSVIGSPLKVMMLLGIYYQRLNEVGVDTTFIKPLKNTPTSV